MSFRQPSKFRRSAVHGGPESPLIVLAMDWDTPEGAEPAALRAKGGELLISEGRR
jgi:hypothetical protein